MYDNEVLDRLAAIDGAGSSTQAEELEALASSMPVGENGRASFLVAAGQYRQQRKEYDEARRLFALALEDGCPATTDPVANLLSLALATGDEAAVWACSADLRGLIRADRIGADGCAFIGEAFRHNGRLREAMRWFTLPLKDRHPEDGDVLDHACLISRYDVRRELGMPEDRLDELAAAQLAVDETADELAALETEQPTPDLV